MRTHIAALALFLIILPCTAHAQDVCSWIAEAGGWGDASNWSCGRVPTAGDEVIVGDGPVTLNSAATIAEFTLQSAAIETFNVDGSLTVTGPMTWSAGTSGSTMRSPTGNGTVTVGGALALQGDGTLTVSDVTLTVNGITTMSFGASNARLHLTNDGVFNNNSTFDIQTDHSIQGTSGTFNNNDILQKSGGTGASTILPSFTNGGQIKVDSGTLILAREGIHTGSIEAMPGTTVQFGDAVSGNPADATLDGGTNPGGISLTGGGLFVLNNGAIEALNTGFTVASDTEFKLEDNDGVLTATGPIVIDGTFDWNGGTINGGSIEVNTELLLTGAAKTLGPGATLVSNGPGTYAIASGDITLDAGAVFNNASGATFTVEASGFFLGDGLFDNDGLLVIANNTGFNTPLDNAGTVRIDASQRLQTNGTFTHTGLVEGLGKLDPNGPVTNTGTFGPGLSPGILTYEADGYTNATLAIEIVDASGPGSGHDQLVVTGTADVGASGSTLTIDASNAVALGQMFTVLTCNSTPPCINGTFETIDITPTGFNFDVVYNPSDITLELTLLPVELTAFEAALNGTDVTLTWRTASETDNAGFEVQHRTSGTEMWSLLAFVEGSGTTSQPQRYTHRVSDLDFGTHAFRLKQIDFDGAFAYSPEVEVTMALTEPYQLSAAAPNPFHSRTDFTLTVVRTQQITIDVHDVLGRRVARIHDGSIADNTPHTFSFIGDGYTSGLYFITVRGEEFVASRQVALVK